MQAYGMSTETVVFQSQTNDVKRFIQRKKLKVITVRAGGQDVMFVQQQQPLIPTLLKKLLTARRRVKKEMKKEPKDSDARKIKDAEQKALKVACNSVYGFFGVQKGMLGIWLISASVTSMGRQLIFQTRDAAINQLKPGKVHAGKWAICNGVSSQVIYGDTDSVMVKLLGIPVTPKGAVRAWKIAQLLAHYITHVIFQRYQELDLEAEDLSSPFLLWPKTKKRYVKRCTEHIPDDAETWGDLGFKLTKKGIEITRRDNVILVKELMGKLLDVMMPLDQPTKSTEEVQDACFRTLAEELHKVEQNELPLAKYVLSKSLKTTYKSKTVSQLFVANTIRQRIADGLIVRVPPNSGDRIPMVCIVKSDKLKQYQCFEDPAWVTVHPDTCVVDRAYILTNQLLKPIYNKKKLPKKDGGETIEVGLLSTICGARVHVLFDASLTVVRSQIGARRFKAQKITNFLGGEQRVKGAMDVLPTLLHGYSTAAGVVASSSSSSSSASSSSASDSSSTVGKKRKKKQMTLSFGGRSLKLQSSKKKKSGNR